MKFKIAQRGIAVYLAIVIMTVILAIGLGTSTILIGQLKISRGIENSVVALYAADTGIEHILYEERLCRTAPCLDGCNGIFPDICLGLPDGYETSSTLLSGEASYVVSTKIEGDEIKFKSIGGYKGTKRAIETTMPLPLVPELAVWRSCEDVATNISWGFSRPMGYRFVPQVSGEIIELCGYFDGTNDVILYNGDYTVATSVPITGKAAISSEWACKEIDPPISVSATTYFVIADITTGGSYYANGSSFSLPMTCNLVSIKEGVVDNIGSPFSGYTSFNNYILGIVDIAFVPAP